MKFWKVSIKYTKIAIPDVILFNNKQVAEYYLESKKDNQNIVWSKLDEKPIELQVDYD